MHRPSAQVGGVLCLVAGGMNMLFKIGRVCLFCRLRQVQKGGGGVGGGSGCVAIKVVNRKGTMK